jgi:hypothetical protein
VTRMKIVPAILILLQNSLENLNNSILSLSIDSNLRKVKSPKISSSKPQRIQASLVLLTRPRRVERLKIFMLTNPNQV